MLCDRGAQAPAPRRVGVFVLPGGGHPGCLETLAVSALSRNEPRVIECARAFFDCARVRPQNMDKATVQCWAATKGPRLSIGPLADRLQLDDQAFASLRGFLQSIAVAPR